MKRTILWVLLLVAAVLLFLGQYQKRTAAEQQQKLAYVVETIRHYQHSLDMNDFEQARNFSTPTEQERLRQLERELKEEAAYEKTVFETVFLDFDCEIDRDSAWCRCLMNDEYEEKPYEADFKLIRQVAGNWLVDAPSGEEDDAPSGEGDESEVIEEVLRMKEEQSD